MSIVISDEILAIYVPIIIYWLYSCVYMMCGRLDKYRLHSRKEEDVKNLVSKKSVAITVLLQQFVQSVVAFLVFKMSNNSTKAPPSKHSILAIVPQIFIAMFTMDTWQYFWHRYMHKNKFLYQRIHSWHHRLIVPYSFGSQYNHPVEGFLLDTVGGALAFLISGMTPRTSIYFFSFAVMKGVDDHCGLWLPGNIFRAFFRNNTAYHDVHHQLGGNKYNFSQPFFVVWDRIFGTALDYRVEMRDGGGLTVCVQKSV